MFFFSIAMSTIKCQYCWEAAFFHAWEGLMFSGLRSNSVALSHVWLGFFLEILFSLNHSNNCMVIVFIRISSVVPLYHVGKWGTAWHFCDFCVGLTGRWNGDEAVSCFVQFLIICYFCMIKLIWDQVLHCFAVMIIVVFFRGNITSHWLTSFCLMPLTVFPALKVPKFLYICLFCLHLQSVHWLNWWF